MHSTMNLWRPATLGLMGLLIVLLCIKLLPASNSYLEKVSETADQAAAREAKALADPNLALATFAGGCFWCMETAYEHVPGVKAVISGFSGGAEKNPTYEQVGEGLTGHAESVQVHYDPTMISYASLVEIFWRQINPTDAGGQYADRGKQYRTAIFYHNTEQKGIVDASELQLIKSGRFNKPIVTEITAYNAFYAAEEYHQNFYLKDPFRYKSYRKGSGRVDYLAKTWKDEKEIKMIPVNADNDGVENKMGEEKKDNMNNKVKVTSRFTKPSANELKKKLSPVQYRVTQESGTERPFENEFWDNHKDGLYVDIVSGEALFSSADKFNSGTGWPSFTKPVDKNSLKSLGDNSLGMDRMEVRSKLGDSHLGHVFDDGPKPMGLRYCINSASLRFIPKEKLEAEGYGNWKMLFEKKP